MGLLDQLKRKLRRGASAGEAEGPGEAQPLAPATPFRRAMRFTLPITATLILLGTFVFGSDFATEVDPGEVAVVYNMSGIGIFGDDAEVIKEQGIITIFPYFQRIEKLDLRPQIFVMEGENDVSDDHVKRLTVRASDGSNFYFEKVEIHYQVISSSAADVIRQNGPGDAYKKSALRVHAREILRNEFGRYSFLDIADPRTYGEATTQAKKALNERLNPLGLEVTNIPPPKPSFDQRVESAIEDRQSAEQEVEVQQEKRNKLVQEKGRRIQQIEQLKNAEYQALIAELEAQRQQAANQLIAVKREADKYWIDRTSRGDAEKAEKVTRAAANEVAYQADAEGLVAQIKATGAAGPDVLNREIATSIFPQLEKLKAVPYSRSQTPLDIRHLNVDGGGK
jgi:regulator of protease activity HflC (stomatin/prohibitin superfamily)